MIRTIKATPKQTWTILGDFKNIHLYHPYAVKTELLTRLNSGVGAKRRCYFNDQTVVEEEIITWIEGQTYTTKVTHLHAIAQAEVCIHLQTDDLTHTKVTIEIDYLPKWGILGKTLNKLFMARSFTRIFGEVLKGLDHYIATGELVMRINRKNTYDLK